MVKYFIKGVYIVYFFFPNLNMQSRSAIVVNLFFNALFVDVGLAF